MPFQPGHRLRKIGRRRGATLTEMTIILLVFLMLVMGMLDLGIMVTRRQSLSQAARCGARAAIVRGEYADSLGTLGPAAYRGTAAADHPIAAAVRAQLYLMDPASVRLEVTWPDGNNEFGSRVRVTAAGDFVPLMTFIFGSPTWTLTGASEMHVAH